MDTALYDGDFLLDNRNRLVTISGLDEILQRIFIILNVKKGSFCYDRDFGSEIYKLRNYSEHIAQRAKMLVEHALYNLDNVQVDSVTVDGDIEDDEIDLTLHLIINGYRKDLEVKI